MEQLINGFSTTLASSYTAGAGSMVLTSATGLPATGTYTLLIRDASTGLPKLLFRVASLSSVTVTGVAEGTDVNANAGDSVLASTLTSASISALLAGMEQYGTISGRPSTAYTGAKYVASDSLFDYARWNGTIWQQFIAGQLCVPPTGGTFPSSYVGSNATEVSYADANDGVVWKVEASSGNNLALRVGPYPTPPFKKRLRIRTVWAGNSYETASVALYNSVSGKAETFGYGLRNDFLRVQGYTWSDKQSPTQFYNGNGASYSFRGGFYEFWVEDTGTTRNFYLCNDGINGMLIWSEANTTFLTPNKIGLGFLTYGNTIPAIMSVLDWSDI